MCVLKEKSYFYNKKKWGYSYPKWVFLSKMCIFLGKKNEKLDLKFHVSFVILIGYPLFLQEKNGGIFVKMIQKKIEV